MHCNHYMQGQRKCELFYQEALRLRPNYTAAWTNLGLVMINTGIAYICIHTYILINTLCQTYTLQSCTHALAFISFIGWSSIFYVYEYQVLFSNRITIIVILYLGLQYCYQTIVALFVVDLICLLSTVTCDSD